MRRGREGRGLTSLPPRPPSPGRDNRVRGGGDSYQPALFNGRDSRRDSRDSHYGNSSRYDTSHQYAPPPGTNDRYQPPSQHYDRFRPDSFRPPQSEFSFRSERPPGIDAPYYHGPSSRRDGEGARGNGQDRRRNRGSNARQYRGRPPFLAANRPMLQPGLSNTAIGQDFVSSEWGATYKAFEDLSDSDEAEMDISGDDSDAGRPSKKKQRVAEVQAASAITAKWSNPDAATALAPAEPERKKKDVVQLIRKARVLSKDAGTATPTGAEDFISCDFDSDGDDAATLASAGNTWTLLQVPTGPRAESRPTSQGRSKHAPTANGTINSARPEKATPTPTELNPSRKRTHNDEIKPQLPKHAKLKKGSKMPVGGFIAADWRIMPGEDPCPWLHDHSDCTDTGIWLHKEIADFYNHVRPRDFEQQLRQDMVDNLSRMVRSRFGDADVYPFGSFTTGLYLPTGDMDLVLCSESFLSSGQPLYQSKKQLYRFAHFLAVNDLASREDMEMITKAKVPLVKYIDNRTGLKVDVSFENWTGIQAIKTFTEWKSQYPAMPVLVTLIKHFLTMRGLNEPMNGGIGGFSIICLVVSMLQLMPQVQSKDMAAEQHYGDLLMHFFDLYGNKFNYTSTAISLNPPAYIRKSQVTRVVYKNPDRLSIIDPNNGSNDISGGSKNFPVIAKVFVEAHDALQKRMADLTGKPNAERRNASLLACIVEGTYASFREQRAHLERLHGKIYGKN